MRGQIISAEFKNIKWVQDKDGKEYACYQDAVDKDGNINDKKEERCLDTSLVLGDSW